MFFSSSAHNVSVTNFKYFFLLKTVLQLVTNKSKSSYFLAVYNSLENKTKTFYYNINIRFKSEYLVV